MKLESYCCGFAFAGEMSVLLIQKKRPAWMSGMWNGIGGHVEDGEAVIDSMVREFLEETGVQTKADDWRGFCLLSHRFRDKTCLIQFFAHTKILDGAPKTMSDEQISWIAVPDIVLGRINVVPNLKYLVPAALCPDASSMTVHTRSF